MAVDLGGKQRQRPQADAVAHLDGVQIAVGKGVVEGIGDTGAAAGGGAHPQNIVVAPLDIHPVMCHQVIQYDVRSRTPVKNIAHDVQAIHDQPFDGGGQRHDKALCLPQIDDGGEDIFTIGGAVFAAFHAGEQLLQYVGKFVGKGLADLTAGVFGGYQPTDRQQPQQGQPIPLLRLRETLTRLLELGVGVKDEGGQLRPFPGGEGIAVEDIHLFPDRAGGVVEDVAECLVFAVNIREKMLSALGQIQNSPQIDDLCRRSADGGILQSQCLQIQAVFRKLRVGVMPHVQRLLCRGEMCL